MLEIRTTIIVKGLFSLEVSHPDERTTWWIDSVTWYIGNDNMEFECGSEFWFEFLPQLAKEANLDLEQLQYEMSSCNAMDRVFYKDSGRWMPSRMQKAIQLAAKEKLNTEELADSEYMQDRYETWMNNELLD